MNMRRSLVKVAGVLLSSALLVVVADPAAAQSSASNDLAQSGEGIGVTFNMQWTGPGFGVDYAKRVAPVGAIRSLSVVGELDVNHFKTHNDITLVGGVRVARHNKTMPSPFFQVLAGSNN